LANLSLIKLFCFTGLVNNIFSDLDVLPQWCHGSKDTKKKAGSKNGKWDLSGSAKGKVADYFKQSPAAFIQGLSD
jgi:hypothetical protein